MMKYGAFILSLFIWGAMTSPSSAQTFPRVEAKITEYDQEMKKLRGDLDRTTANPRNKDWVKKKLDVMFKQDQYSRRFIAAGYQLDLSEAEKRAFVEKMSAKMTSLLNANVMDLKAILQVHEWVKVSQFTAKTDNDAWMIVTNADQDLAFQKKTLATLAKLWESKETSPRNFAYLSDQLAVKEGKPQMYGTQGACKGEGRWEPYTLAEPETINDRRARMGMETLEDYIKRFEVVCKAMLQVESIDEVEAP